MATLGIIQRRDNKANLISGIPSGIDPDATWSGYVIEGEIVYALDTDEIGFLDKNAVLQWRDLSDIGSSTVNSLDDLSDVDVTSILPTLGQVLIFNGTDKWLAGTIETGDISSGLEAIDEGNGIGWKLIGRDPNSYSNIGQEAVDFSLQTLLGNGQGASGYNSAAFGNDSTASGSSSLSIGYGTLSNNTNSFATGNETTASGIQSTTFGYKTTASGENSISSGKNTIASGIASIAMGYAQTFGKISASGNGSFVAGYNISGSLINGSNASNSGSILMGYGTGYHSSIGIGSIGLGFDVQAGGTGIDGQVIVGKYNDTAGSTFNAQFVVGIGQEGLNNSKNGFAVFEDGQVSAPELSILLIDDVNTDDRVLITKEWAKANSSSTSSTGLENLTENVKSGWRLIGRDPAGFFNLGQDSIDFSVGGDEWESGAGGDYSMAFGKWNRAEGYGSLNGGKGNSIGISARTSVTLGESNTVNAPHSMAMGLDNTIDENNKYSTAFGTLNIVQGILGTSNFITGENNTINSGYKNAVFGESNSINSYTTTSVVFGNNNISSVSNQAIFGTYNASVNTLISVGNGASGNLSNAFEVYFDGSIIAPSITNTLIDTNVKSLTSNEWVKNEIANIPSSVGGLLIKDGLGYRISGLTSDTLGTNALNLSTLSTAISTGNSSISINGQATGLSPSIAIGGGTIASGNYTTAIGADSQATSDYTLAIGKNARATGASAIAFGYGSIASGTNSVAIGSKSSALQNYSFAQGFYSTSDSAFSASFGTYNVAKIDSLFEIGNGVSGTKANAFEVLKTGKVFAPQLTNTLIDEELSTSKILITKDYAESNYGGSIGGTALSTTTDITNFNNNLSSTDTDVQKALDTLDNLAISTTIAWGDIIGTLSDQTDLQTDLTNLQTNIDTVQSNVDLKQNDLGLGTASQFLATNATIDGTEWVDAPTGEVSQLEKVGTGWRILGFSPVTPGADAISLSKSSGVGATGANSFTAGYYTTATGQKAIAIGDSVTSSGFRSLSMGYQSVSSGQGSVTIGYSVNMATDGGCALGIYNVGGSLRLLEVGNGIDNNTRSNAFEVYTTGEIIAPSVNNITIDAASVKVLTTKEWVTNEISNSVTGADFTDTDSVGDGITISFPIVYTIGKIQVFIDGLRIKNSDFVATNGTDVVFNTAPLNNSWILFTVFT